MFQKWLSRGGGFWREDGVIPHDGGRLAEGAPLKITLTYFVKAWNRAHNTKNDSKSWKPKKIQKIQGFSYQPLGAQRRRKVRVEIL